jgi:hypothetical protein
VTPARQDGDETPHQAADDVRQRDRNESFRLDEYGGPGEQLEAELEPESPQGQGEDRCRPTRPASQLTPE